MKSNVLKMILAVFVALPIFGVAVFSTITQVKTESTFDEPETVYKTKCAMCHKKDASKFFDPEKSDEHHVTAILKGQKGEKPPFMPGFEKKGITEEQAQALTSYMRSQLPDDEANSNSNTGDGV